MQFFRCSTKHQTLQVSCTVSSSLLAPPWPPSAKQEALVKVQAVTRPLCWSVEQMRRHSRWCCPSQRSNICCICMKMPKVIIFTLCRSHDVCPLCVPVVNAYQFVTTLFFSGLSFELRQDDWMFGGWLMIEWMLQAWENYFWWYWSDGWPTSLSCTDDPGWHFTGPAGPWLAPRRRFYFCPLLFPSGFISSVFVRQLLV